MKYTIVGCLLALGLFCACGSEEDRARKLIETQLQETVGNWESYQFVEMTRLDSTYTSFSSTEAGAVYRVKKDSLNKLKQLRQMALKELDEHKDASRKTVLEDSVSLLEQQLLQVEGEYLSAEQRYEGEFNGFRTRFRYKINNEHDVQVMENRWYFFDKDMTEITQSFR